MSTSTKDTTVVLPQDLNAPEVNGKMAQKITDILKSQYKNFTYENQWNKSENGDISHSIYFRKGWFEGFNVVLEYKNSTRIISFLISPWGKFEGSMATIVGIPIVFIVYIIMLQYIKSSYEIEDLSIFAHLVSLSVGSTVGAVIGFGTSKILSTLIISTDLKTKNKDAADDVLETCLSAAQEFLSNYVAPQDVAQSSSPSPVQVPEQSAKEPSTLEKSKKADESKLCPRCYAESNTFFICKECGYVNKAVGITLFVISLIGLAIGVHGLLAWIAAQNRLWVEIAKTLLCGFPGVLLAYLGIAEVVYLRKSRGWTERHNHDMKELLGFYEKNPNAGFAEAGKFLNHTEQWVELMLNESKSKKG